MIDRSVESADIHVSYTEAGDGPPVVLVHGLAEDRATWRVQQRDLTGVRSYAYDLRGHGGTAVGAADGTLDQLADDLVAFLEQVSGAATCVGFSLGGTVVLSAAARRPDLVSHAIVLGTSSVVGRAAAEFYAGRIELVRSGDAAAVAAAMTEDTAAAITRPEVDVADVTRRRLAAVGGGAGYVNAARAMAGLREHPLTPALGDVRCHVDVIGADSDTFCPRKAADIVVDGLPDATYHEITGAGHLVNSDRPTAVTDVLNRLLEGTGIR